MKRRLSLFLVFLKKKTRAQRESDSSVARRGLGESSPFGIVEEPPWSDAVLSVVNALLATAILVRDIAA